MSANPYSYKQKETMKIKTYLPAFALLLAIGALSHSAAAQTRSVVKFRGGTHSASAKGTVKGYAYIDYILGARAGQHMLVEMDSNNDKAQLVILDPDKENVDEGTGVAGYSGDLEKTGNYTVRVLMSRAEARRKGSATSFVVTFTIQ
jgi:hypothetical protein